VCSIADASEGFDREVAVTLQSDGKRPSLQLLPRCLRYKGIDNSVPQYVKGHVDSSLVQKRALQPSSHAFGRRKSQALSSQIHVASKLNNARHHHLHGFARVPF
jgi:hypothetical protein